MDNIFRTLQQLSRICGEDEEAIRSNIEGFGLESPGIDDTTDSEGRSIRRITTGFLSPEDWSIPLGTWRLRLIPTPVETPDEVRIPIVLICNRGDNSFRELRVEIARFELEADPNHLIAADLHTEPHTHLTPTEGHPPVKLLGPGCTLILRGTELEDFDIEFTGATGSSDSEFPSVRFEPPHFVIARGGEPTKIGVVCDEVILDLKRGANPSLMAEMPDFEESWRGLIMKELGVFIGDGTEVGTWSGMAAMKNFFIGFDAVDLSGTFIAELVHYALDTPQVPIAIYYQNEEGEEIRAADGGDAEIPAPPEGRDYVRVRLEARPNWDSAGFRVRWGPPAGVTIEEPLRLSELNLGWVRAPPGEHTFELEITDHRVELEGIPITRRVIVNERTISGEEAGRLTIVFDGRLLGAGFAEGERPTNRLHISLQPGQQVLLSARIGGGTGPITATLNLPDGFDTGDELVQTVTRPEGSSVYESLQWTITAPGAAPTEPHGVFELTVSDEESATVLRLLRVRVEELLENHRDFELVSYSDWRADPGIGLARIQLLNGLQFSHIEWTLDSQDIDESLFSDSLRDELFNGGSYLFSESVNLSNSAGTVRPFLHADNRLWRLTGRVPAAPSTTIGRAPIVVGLPLTSLALTDPNVRGFLGAESPEPVAYQTDEDWTVRTILFRFDCAEVPPLECTRVGPEYEYDSIRLTPEQTDAEQAKGFAALFRVIEEYREEIDEIALFGMASLEGERPYNMDLSLRRLGTARDQLITPSRELIDAMESLDEPDRYSITDDVRSIISELDGRDAILPAIDEHAFGEEHAIRVPVNGRNIDNLEDRCVFAIIKLRPALSDRAVVHREYFVTLPGALPPAETPNVPQRQLQDHPFRHAIFRQAHVEVELLHNELVRLQVRLKLDLEKFNENDVLPGGDLNELDGLTTFFLEMRRNPEPGPEEPEYSWELVVLSDPGDVDGIALIKKPEHSAVVDILGPPAVVIPALTAISGGRIGLYAFLIGVSVGELLSGFGILDVQTLIWRGIRFRVLHGNVERPTMSLAVDYTVRYNIDADLSNVIPGLRLTTSRPIEISFRNVGVEVRPGSTNIEFFYNPEEGFQLDVNDPGVFRLGDGIGRLLNVERFRTGAGSPLWFEVELSLTLETGIFSLDTLRIRVSLDTGNFFEPDDAVTLNESSVSVDDFTVSLNKLGASVNVPGVLKGSGEFGITEETYTDETGEAITGTTIEGQIDIGLIPLDIRIYGGLKVFTAEQLRALYAYLGVDFAPGILLGSTGAAIYGFHGLIGVNMQRNNPEPLPWFTAAPVGATDTGKWIPGRGNWAFGVGTVVGTAYDTGFSFNTKGSFILEIPGPKFLLGTESKFIRKKPPVGGTERGTIISVVMLDLENKLFLIGIDFNFVKENLLEFRVPTEIFFNLNDANDWYIRFGQWDPESKRITLKLLNFFKAWGYFVLEGNGLQIEDKLDLQGICLATGARVEIFWGSRDINLYLEAYVEMHLGLQIDPLQLQGIVMVGGELHLIIIALGARGELEIIAPEPFVLRGEICGKLDLWLFSIEGCASFTIGDSSAQLPDPPNPVKEIVLIDRMTSSAVPSVSEEELPPAPLDVVVHLVFDQDMIDDRPDDERGVSVSDLGRPRNQVSGDLFYEYMMEEVSIIRVSDGVAIPLQSAWGPYSLPTPEEGEERAAENADSTRTLRLFDWVPNCHARALDFRRGYGVTLRALISRLCDPTLSPSHICATFDEEPLGVRSYWQLDERDLSPVRVISAQADGLGAEYMGRVSRHTAARVVPLVPVNYDNRAAQKYCLQLTATGWSGQFTLEGLLSWLGEQLKPHEAFERERILALTGLLVIHLPDLVAADAIFVVPERLPVDGEVVFLDVSFQPISAWLSIQAAPVVDGSAGTGTYARYVARRISFGPPADTDEAPPRASWLVIKPPGTKQEHGITTYSYLNEICGIKYGEWRRWRDRVGDKARAILDLQGFTGIFGGLPAATTQELLDPNTIYEVTGRIRWARYRDAVTTENDGEGTYEHEEDRLVSFKASFQTVEDYPKDIRRYVLDHNPIDDKQPHYYEELVRITFASDVLDRLFAKFGYQLVARAKADTGTHVVNQPMSVSEETRDFFPFGSFEETLYNALMELRGDCLPGDWERLFPKFVFPFAPLTANTGYTITLIPRPLGEPGDMTEEEWNNALETDFNENKFVYRFDIRTSRWASFNTHIDAYRSAPIGDIFASVETALDRALAEITEQCADASIDTLCMTLFGGPIAIPKAPQVLRIWASTDPAPDPFSTPPYRCRGILLDGPEPLLKYGVNGNPRVELNIRKTNRSDEPFSSGTRLSGEQIITGSRGARVFVMFDESTPPPFIRMQLHDVPGEGRPEVLEEFAIEIGDTPGSFREEVD